MASETWTAIIAGATFAIFWTATVLGGGFWLSNKFNILERRMLQIFAEHEKEDNRRFENINIILMRRFIRDNSEFKGIDD